VKEKASFLLLLLAVVVMAKTGEVGMIIGNESEKLIKASLRNLQCQQKRRLRKGMVAASETPRHNHSSIHHHCLIQFNNTQKSKIRSSVQLHQCKFSILTVRKYKISNR
jgi:hypothetical protein